MKTKYGINEVQSFLTDKENAISDSIEQFPRGHISQAYGFEDAHNNRLVLRVAPNNKDFLADKFAYDKFGKNLPIPKIVEIGKFDEESFYCISERVKGNISDKLTDEEMKNILPVIHKEFASMFKTDISIFTGYGHPDINTGNAPFISWGDVMQARLDDIYGEGVEQSAINLGLGADIVGKFRQQYDDNLEYASEVRRLTHGDLGFDNLLVDNGRVTALIDWAGIGYGDWMYDFAKLDFWWPKRFGDAKEFADKYDLDADNLEQRKALYWARSALSTIQWADEVKNAHISDWLRTYVKNRII